MIWLGSGWMLSNALSVPELLSGDRWAPPGLTYPAHVTMTLLTTVVGLGITALLLLDRPRTGDRLRS